MGLGAIYLCSEILSSFIYFFCKLSAIWAFFVPNFMAWYNPPYVLLLNSIFLRSFGKKGMNFLPLNFNHHQIFYFALFLLFDFL